MRAKPFCIVRNFTLARGKAHLAWNNKLPYFLVLSNEDLIGGEDHIFEVFHRLDAFHLQPCALKGDAECLPLALGLLSVDGYGILHVGILDVTNSKMGWRTQQDTFHGR